MTVELKTLFTALVTLTALASTRAQANVTGNDSQNFNPVTGRSDFVTVQSASILAPGRFSLGVFFNQATNSLPYSRDEAESGTKFKDSVTGMDVVVGVGILPDLELGLALPFIIDQQVNNDDTRGEFAEQGNTEVKPVIKYAFVHRANLGLTLIASANINRLQDDPYTGTATSPVYNAELAIDTHFDRWTMALNVGYRARRPGEKIDGALVDPITNEALASTAIAYGLTSRFTLLTELFGSRILKEIHNETDRAPASAEVLLGARYAFNNSVMGHLGGGRELLHGLATPDLRFYLGVTTEFGPAAERRRAVAKRNKRNRIPESSNEDGALDAPDMDDNGPGIDAIPDQEPDEVFVLRNINFEFDSDYRVLPGTINELDKLNAHLTKKPYTKLVIEGHTDYYGSDEYNDALSLRRARSVRRQLIKYYNARPEDAIAVGYGERRPLTMDTSDNGRQLNRRVEIKIYRDSSRAN